MAGKDRAVRSCTLDSSRTPNGWLGLSLESLRFKCNSLNLSSHGAAAVLAQCLFTHFNPPPAFVIDISTSIVNATRVSSNEPSSSSISTTNTTNVFVTIDTVRQEFRSMIPELVAALQTGGSQQPTVDAVLDNNNVVLRDDQSSCIQNVQLFNLLNNTNNTNDTNLLRNVQSHTTSNNSLADFNLLETNTVKPPEHNADMLPPLPKAVLLKIKQGKFVNFNLLLPQSYCPSTNDDYVVQVGGGDDGFASSITLVPKLQNSKAKVLTFTLWLQAWCNFARVYVRYHGHQTDQILHYQSLMAQFGQQYVFNEFYSYDRQFRLRIASNPALRWDRIDGELTNRFLRTVWAVCFRCHHTHGHYATACPLSSPCYDAPSGGLSSFSGNAHFRSGGDSRFASGSRFSQRPAGFPTMRPVSSGAQSEYRFPSHQLQATGSQHTCWYFNTNGFCTNSRCSSCMCVAPAGGSTPLVVVPNATLSGFETVSSPVNVQRLTAALLYRPDRSLVNSLLNGFSYGFDLGYKGSINPGTQRNLLSARAHHKEVSTALAKEVSHGHTEGPFDVSPFPILNVSLLGAVKKKDGSYRIILDLSSPQGESVNDGIDRLEYSVWYQSFDDAVDLVCSLGVGTAMAKVDIKHAFRLCPCPVCPQDFLLLGMHWDNQFYFDTRLPFGGRSSPFSFNSFADALAWILIFVCGISYVLHYLDDFFIASAQDTVFCNSYVQLVKDAFTCLGYPLPTISLRALQLVSLTWA